MTGFSDATVCSQPSSSDSGTYTGARKRIRKTGSCMTGPACSERKEHVVEHRRVEDQLLHLDAGGVEPADDVR
ncbi:MAG TPA: hypothetical protein VFU10_13930 [Gaiellaceae bacterium]|nr:hypothetical protein [Gaiellaceae bacterium]